MYGLKQNPKASFDILSAGLIERGFTPSAHDPCLFMKKDMICVVYVDDTIIAGPDSDAIEHEIKLLGITNDEYHHKFQLRDEGEVGDFSALESRKLDQINST